MGVVIVLSSYTIFGVAQDYMPTLATIVNRINLGASLGLCMILACLSSYVASGLSIFFFERKEVAKNICLTLLIVPLVSFWTLTNWGFSKPWVQSWEVQKEITQFIVKHSSEIQPGNSILLANIPRYNLWAPLFDGVWDFQSMMRMKLNDPKISAGVVSERLELDSYGARDVSLGCECAVYKFKAMKILVPNQKRFFIVSNVDSFVDTVSTYGMDFGLSKTTLERWQSTLHEHKSSNSKTH
jgi:hypothetical protein